MVNLYIPIIIAKMNTWKFYVVLLDTQSLQTHFTGFFWSPSMALHYIYARDDNAINDH